MATARISVIRDEPVECRLQDGIYFRRHQRPGRCYRLVLLEVGRGTTLRETGQALAVVWGMLQGLRHGIVRDLRPANDAEARADVPSGDLTCLLALGAPLFDRFVRLSRPRGVVPLGEAPFTALHRVSRGDRRTGEAPLAVQFIADTDLAVDRAVVETWVLIKELALPLEVVTVHGGFNRDDGRSWLGFYDGTSNIRPDQRRAALEVCVKDPPWMHGGTYMSFLRLAIDLAAWRALSRE